MFWFFGFRVGGNFCRGGWQSARLLLENIPCILGTIAIVPYNK
jgi:hypothetical protein